MRSPRRRYARMPGETTKSIPQPRIPSFIESAFVRPRSQMSDADAASQMASDMREAAYRAGGVSRDDLLTLGFSGDQIDRLGTKAARKAQAAAGGTCVVA